MNLFATIVAVAIGSWVVVPGGSWSPSPEQINEVRSRIAPFVQQQAKVQHQELPIWSQYSFQYQGQLDDGKKIIFVNAFCISPPEYTLRKFVEEFDGGPCFFQVKYDPQKKMFLQLIFNGSA